MRLMTSRGYLLAVVTVALAGCAATPRTVEEVADQGGCAPHYRWNSLGNRGVILWDCNPAAPGADDRNEAVVQAD